MLIVHMPLPLLLLDLVFATMLACLALIVFVPFFPGVAVMFTVIVAYVGYASFMAQGFAGIAPLSAGLVVLFALSGIFSSWWTEKLGLRFTYVSQQVMWGAIIGSLVIGMVRPGMFWFMIGMIIGAIATELSQRKPFVEAVRQGVAAVYSMLGPRGFQLLMAMLIIDVSLWSLGTLPSLLR
jgi:uncharacterized protein YqgC (DUF456 family)